MNNRQRNVLSPISDDETAFADDREVQIQLLVRAREMLNRIDRERLDDESMNRLGDALAALNDLITSLIE